MLVEFLVSGKVGLYYGTEGVIEVKKGEVREVLNKRHTAVWFNDGIAKPYEKPSEDFKEVKDEPKKQKTKKKSSKRNKKDN